MTRISGPVRAMRRAAAWCFALPVLGCIVVACTSFGGAADDAVDGGAADGGADSEVPVRPACDPAKPFRAPAPLGGPVNSRFLEGEPSLTDDELTLYFNRNRTGKGNELFVATRLTRDGDFGEPIAITELNTSSDNVHAAITLDGSVLFFAALNGTGNYDLYRSARDPTSNRFSAATPLTAFNTAAVEFEPSVVGRGEELWFSRGPRVDLYRAPRLEDGGFGAATAVAELNSALGEKSVASTRDGLTVYFASRRLGPEDVWMASRSSLAAAFSPPVLVPELSSASADVPRWLSSDGCRIYLYSDRNGTFDLFMASRPP